MPCTRSWRRLPTDLTCLWPRTCQNGPAMHLGFISYGPESLRVRFCEALVWGFSFSLSHSSFLPLSPSLSLSSISLCPLWLALWHLYVSRERAALTMALRQLQRRLPSRGWLPCCSALAWLAGFLGPKRGIRLVRPGNVLSSTCI